LPPTAPANLFQTVDGDYGAHGRFDSQARAWSWEMVTRRHAQAAALAVFGLAVIGLAALSRAGRNGRVAAAISDQRSQY
jgi:hypothetical protein